MATTTTPGKCLHLLSSKSTRLASRVTTTSSLARRHLHTPTPPLYLDFLAPSWRTPHPSPSAPRSRAKQIPTTPLTQTRHLSTTLPRSAKAISNPRKDDSGAEMTISITPRAAHRLQTISETDSNPHLALRVSVESGGCHGFQYLMSFVSAKDADPEEDTVFENEEVARRTGGEYKAKVIMDEPSLELLKGSSIDYTMELIGSQFKVTGIPGATSSCGCGTSFDIA